jgi:hypothetical protein
MDTGQLTTSLNLRIVVNIVAGATSVDEFLLLEDAEFLKFARSADDLTQVIAWVRENY